MNEIGMISTYIAGDNNKNRSIDNIMNDNCSNNDLNMVIQYTNVYQNYWKNAEIVCILQVHVISYLLFKKSK